MSTLDTLRAGVLRNKVPLGAGGVAVVGLLAWRARTAKASSSATPAAGTSPVPSSYSVGTQTAGATGYDSTASDVYNAIQPQLEQLSNLWSKNQAIPIPVPAAPVAAAPHAAPQSLGYVSVQPAAGTGPNGSIQQLFDNGTSRWISYAEQQLNGISAPTVLSQAEFAPYKTPYSG